MQPRPRDDSLSTVLYQHYAKLQARSRQLAQTLADTDVMQQRIAALIETLDTIQGSTAWKIAEFQLRFMMNPSRLGRGDTALDTLQAQVEALREQLESLPVPGDVPQFKWLRGAMTAELPVRASIIVLNHGGAEALDRMFSSYLAHHAANRAEWIVVDQASSDWSREVIQRFMERLPLSMIAFEGTYAPARANNFAACFAQGTDLVFCSRDIIFDQALLDRLLLALADPGVGVAGACLYAPDDEGRRSDTIRHAGIDFQYHEPSGAMRPVDRTTWNDSGLEYEPVPAVSPALLACRSRDFVTVGGFEESGDRRYEDVDLSLAIAGQTGKAVVVAHAASAIHSGSTGLHPQRDEAWALDALRPRQRILQARYGEQLTPRYLSHRGAKGHHEPEFTVGLVVTEADPRATTGDYFTALELALALEKELGWSCNFLARQDPSRDCFDCAGLDALIVLIDDYDLSHIHGAPGHMLRIAWPRNWFERWLQRSWFHRYDLVLCSSDQASGWLAARCALPVSTMRIATNPDRFRPGAVTSEEFHSDYCFTGSYWKSPRQIEEFDPRTLPYTFALYGSGWEHHEQFADSWRGHLPYADIKQVYAGTRLLIDDANHVTRPWGSVNSRVFDALAAGTLVLSNNELGARETFDGLLPTWSSIAELENLVQHFMQHPQERESLARQLQAMVLERQTYAHRAWELSGILDRFRGRRSLAIKMPVPGWEGADNWGDFHFAAALSRSLLNLGYRVRLDTLPEWYAPGRDADEVVIVLRGLSEYEPRPNQLNLLWNISHPEKVGDAEYERYDHLFIASLPHAKALSARLGVPVTPLLQCTDPERFHWLDDRPFNDRVVFVGNSRGVARPIVMHAIESGLDPEVYGKHWSGLIDPQYIRGEHIENERLGDFYAESGVVLNDHWTGMRESGFISNRLFDLAACGAVFVTDAVAGARAIFGACLFEYQGSADSLRATVEQARHSRDRDQPLRRALAETMAREHSFDARARQIHEVILAHNATPQAGQQQA